MFDRSDVDLVFRRLRERAGEPPERDHLPRCANLTCERLFTPTQPDQRFCQRCLDATAEADVRQFPARKGAA